MAGLGGMLGAGWDDPKTLGLLSAAAALLQAGGPSRVPISLGQALGSAMSSGLQGYQGQQQLLSRKKSQEQEQELNALQLEQARNQMQQQRDFSSALSNVPQGNWRPPMAPGTGQSETIEALYKRISNNPALLSNPYAIKAMENMQKLMPKYKADSQTIRLPNGELATVMTSDDGRQIISPFTPAQELKTVDLGGKLQFYNPLTGQTSGQGMAKSATPGDLLSSETTRRGQDMTDARDRLLSSPTYKGQVTGAETLAKSRANAASTLPQVIDTAMQGMQNIDAMIGQRDAQGNLLPGQQPHPGFSNSVGMGVPFMKHVPGSNTADFNARLDQVLGGAFMQAYQTLKGGGQITEIEGQKATSAITRMNTAQSEKEFIQAANEFKSVVQNGIMRAKQMAGPDPGDGGNIPPKKVVRTGTLNGRKVVQYEDGTTEYAN